MALDVGRWWKYAQARLGRAVRQADAELDDLEAEQRARAEGRPWLDADGRAPTLDEARARIEWEADQQGTAAAAPAARASDGPPPPTPAPTSDAAAPGAARTSDDEDPEVAQARLELERQARESKERLAAIRDELGITPPEDPPATP